MKKLQSVRYSHWTNNKQWGDYDSGSYNNSRVVCVGTIGTSYNKSMVSRFKVDTPAQADNNSFGILVDSSDG